MKQFDPGAGASIASITDKVRPLAVGMPVSSVHYLGETAVFVGAEESAAIAAADGEMRESRLVFIGRELPEQMIRDGFESCITT